MMSVDFIAHSSPRDDPEKPPHLYVDHINGVEKRGLCYAHELFHYALGLPYEEITKLCDSLILALRVHDIGKLEPGNQKVLSGKLNGRLPYDHVDGGVAVALNKKDTLAAWLVRAHHSPGLASCTKERALGKRLYPSSELRGKRHNRSDYSTDIIEQHKILIEETDRLQNQLILKHEKSCSHELTEHHTRNPSNALTTRLLLSCLVDADHSDTAEYYSKNSNASSIPPVRTRWNERLKKLEHYVSKLKGSDPSRKKLRDELFQQCRGYPSRDGILTCAAPVGLGKTTAVMANLLNCAQERKLRRIFIIAPYTSIITQTVNTLRKAVVLEGEDPRLIIAENHHRIEFDSPDLRQYVHTWKAPIIVTTAIQFFETIASASPASIRKLHELPGSAIFLDECHACVPSPLMRQTWYWIRQLSQNWSCHFALASGSLIKFWERSEIVGEENQTNIPSMLSTNFFSKAKSAEQQRVDFHTINDGAAIEKSQLLEHIQSEKTEKGSKLIILNTVQSAAVIAKALQHSNEIDNDIDLSERSVLHISTALTPNDREHIIKEIEARQSKNSIWKNQNWYLVATSCIEAGIDLDFDFGYRERCSVTSFLQTSGRVNRQGLRRNSVVYDFILQESDGIAKHPAFKDSINVFTLYWNEISQQNCDLDELSTRALVEEIKRKENNDQFVSNLLKHEKCCDFQLVQKEYKIIKSETVTAIVDPSLQDNIEKGIPVSFRKIQQNSVQIWSNKIETYNMTPCKFGRNLYYWCHGYDSNFLGYMKNLDILLGHDFPIL